MQLPTSPFQKFLETIRENTIFTFDENPYLRSFEQRLKVFEFVKRVMQERKEEMPELDKYKAILGQMKAELESTEPFAPVDENDEANDLKTKLTPMGRFFLSILRNEENSYYKMVTMWLESVGIDTPFKYLFLEPIHQVYLQGLTEVETMVNKVWEALWEIDVRPVFNSFPFNTQVEQEIAPSSLEALLTPGGHFRKTFKSLILPVCQINGDTLTRRDFPMGSIKLPENMFETEKEIRRLSKIFLNEEGTPQPLTIFIKPLLSHPSEEQDAMVLLSYLQAGKLSVFGFYQQPLWQKFQFEWWKDQPSSVGVEVATKKKSRKSSRGMTIPKSSWSLYRLLQKAEIIDDNTYVWEIHIPEMRTGTIDLKFAIKDDPWAVFNNTQQ
jgi:type VI protein secretion system component VasK